MTITSKVNLQGADFSGTVGTQIVGAVINEPTDNNDDVAGFARMHPINKRIVQGTASLDDLRQWVEWEGRCSTPMTDKVLYQLLAYAEGGGNETT